MRGRAGPVTEISVFATDISVTGMKIFPYEHSSPVNGTKLFKQNSVALTTYRPKWHNFGLVCISSLGVCELTLLVKLQDSTKLWQSRTILVYVPPFWLCFLNSLRSTGLKFPIWTQHRIRPGNRASPVTGLIWRGRPLVCYIIISVLAVIICTHQYHILSKVPSWVGVYVKHPNSLKLFVQGK